MRSGVWFQKDKGVEAGVYFLKALKEEPLSCWGQVNCSENARPFT